MKSERKYSPLQITSLLIVMALLVLTYFATSKLSIQQLKNQVAPTLSLYPQAKPLTGELNLLNDQNKTVQLSEIANKKWSLLYFGYTSCPDVCPTDLAILNQAVSNMKLANRLQIIFISVDPKRDLGKLNAFVARFNQDFIGLSATHKNLVSLTKQLGVYHEKSKAQQKIEKVHGTTNNHMDQHGSYLINHTASYILLNPDLKLTGLLTNPHYSKQIASALDLTISALD
jgi:protein SCO1/2